MSVGDDSRRRAHPHGYSSVHGVYLTAMLFWSGDVTSLASLLLCLLVLGTAGVDESGE